MPLHDVGYRAWAASPSRWPTAVAAIASTGCRLVWRSRGVRRLVYLACIPAAYLGLAIFAFEKAVEYPEWQAMLRAILHRIPGAAFLPPGLWQRGAASITNVDLHHYRYQVWSLVLLTLLRYPQGFLMVVLVGWMAPGLVARDLRSRSYLLYFSRPLSLIEYIVGKSAIIWTFLLAISALPAMILYIVGVCLSSDAMVLVHTWDLPLRVLASSLVLLLPTTALALALSSLSTENRNGLFSWIAIWILGWTIYYQMETTYAFAGIKDHDASWWTCVSLYHVLGNVQAWIFGRSTDPWIVATSAIILAVITIVSYAVMSWRVSAPLRM